MCTDLPHAGYFIPGSCADMDTSQGAWIPAEKYFPDQDLKLKKATQRLFSGPSSKQTLLWLWALAFLFSQPTRRGPRASHYLSRGLQGREGTAGPEPGGPVSQPLYPQNHRAAWRRGVCPHPALAGALLSKLGKSTISITPEPWAAWGGLRDWTRASPGSGAFAQTTKQGGELR